jgi:hypothetical protein
MEEYLQPIRIPSKEELISMALDEEEARKSEEYIEKCSAYAHVPNGWLINVTAPMQLEIVLKHGFHPGLEADIAVNYLRRAHVLYKDEPIFTRAVQVVNNLAKKGTFTNGDTVPNLRIHTLKKSLVRLYDILDQSKMNLVITSSHT